MTVNLQLAECWCKITALLGKYMFSQAEGLGKEMFSLQL